MMMDLREAFAAQLEAGHGSKTVPTRGPGSASGDPLPHTETPSSRSEPPRAGQTRIRAPIPPPTLSSLISRAHRKDARKDIAPVVARSLVSICSNTDNSWSRSLGWLQADTWQNISPRTACNQYGKTAPNQSSKKKKN